MRILWVEHNLYRAPNGGSNTHNRALIEAWRTLGHDVHVLTLASPEEASNLRIQRKIYGSLRRLAPSGAAVWFRDLYSLWSNRQCNANLRAAIGRFQPDVVYERFTDFHNGASIARGHGVRYFLEIHATQRERAAYRRSYFQELYNSRQLAAARGAERVIVVSNALRRELASQGVPPERIRVVPNGVDPSLFMERGLRTSSRRRLGLAGDDFVVGFVGTLQPFHGAPLLPAVCQKLSSHTSRVRFLVVGSFLSSAAAARFEREARSRNVYDRFVMTGALPLKEVPGCVEAMDVCVMPDSNDYGSPIKLFEYGALGKPCVMPRYGPIEEILRHEVNGLLFEPSDLDGMCSQILRVYRDASLAASLGARLRETVLANHTWLQNARRILAD